MGYVEETLLSGETIQYRTKLTKWIFARHIFWFSVCAILGVVTIGGALASGPKNAGGGVLCSGLFWFGCMTFGIAAIGRFLDYKGSEFAVTNRRIIVKHGVISRHTVELQLSKVESSRVWQGIVARILGYGNVVVTGSGGTNEVFPSVANPQELKRQIQVQADASQSGANRQATA